MGITKNIVFYIEYFTTLQNKVFRGKITNQTEFFSPVYCERL